jgi:hypothetical protein
MSAAIPTNDRLLPISPLAALIDEWGDGQRAIGVRINDRLRFEIKDEGSFRLLVELLERMENIDAIQAGLDDFEAGRAVSFDQFKSKLRMATAN